MQATEVFLQPVDLTYLIRRSDRRLTAEVLWKRASCTVHHHIHDIAVSADAALVINVANGVSLHAFDLVAVQALSTKRGREIVKENLDHINACVARACHATAGIGVRTQVFLAIFVRVRYLVSSRLVIVLWLRDFGEDYL